MNIHRQSVDSISEMIECLRRCNTKKILLGQDSEVEGTGNIFRLEMNGIDLFMAGVISEGHGLKPECKYVNDKLLVGFNKEIHVIDIGSNSDNTLYAGSLFYEFLPDYFSDKIVAVFETDIICFSFDGKIIWKYYAKDILSEWCIENNVIYLTTFEGIKDAISLQTGKNSSASDEMLNEDGINFMI